MRTPYRIASTALAVGALLPWGIAPAHADTKPVKVDKAAWFWSAQQSGELAPGTGVGVPSLPKDAAAVKPGNLAVAYKGDTTPNTDGTKTSVPDKETYLAWDLYGLPEGTWVDSFTFTLFVDPTATNVTIPQEIDAGPQGKKGGPPKLVACVAKSGFADGTEGEAFSLKPEHDCTDQLFGEYDATKQAYTFDATTFAQDWVDGKENNGLGIRPTEDAVEPFQLSFLPAAKIVTSFSYTLPTPELPLPTQEPIAPFVPIAPPPVDTGTSVFVPEVVQPQPQPQAPAPAPVVRTTRAPVAIQNVAANPLRSTRGLSPAFWLALVGGTMILGATSLILGDPLVPAASGRSRTRVAGGRHRASVPVGAGRVPARAPRPRTV